MSDAAAPGGPRRYAGWHVVVTGAASGLGAAAARGFAEAGARVVLADLDGAAAEATARALDPSGRVTRAFACDVADPAANRRLVAAAEGFFGAPLDVFLANAGLGFAGPLVEADPAGIRRVVEVNVLGTIYSAQAALASLVSSPRRPDASLLVTSSLQGVVARMQRSVYTATKHALVGLTKALALEFGPRGVRVNAIAPAAVDTGFLRRQLALVNDDVEAAVAASAAALPLGRLPTPDEFAAAAMWLASPAAGSVTGHTLLLDGGASAGPFRRP